MNFLIEKRIDFWWKMEPTGSPRGPQNPGISASFRASFPGPPQRRKMDPKWPQNGAKMESKWCQNGIKMDLKSKEKLVNFYVELDEFSEDSCQVSKLFLDGFTCLFQEMLRHFLEIPEDFHWNSWGIRTELVGKSIRNRRELIGTNGEQVRNLAG